MQNIIEISSENTFESEKTIDSQENILEDKMNAEFNANEAPKILDMRCQRKCTTNIFGKVKSVEAKRNLEVCELFEDFSDSDVFGSPAIFDRYSQMKKKQIL